MTHRLREPVAKWSSTLPNVRSKSIYEAASETDGLRVLATQYWPRGIAKTAVDEYLRILGPSRPLLHSFRDGEMEWSEYRRRYASEMRGETQQAEMHRLAKIAREGPVTVLCVCKDEQQCHRSILRVLISRMND